MCLAALTFLLLFNLDWLYVLVLATKFIATTLFCFIILCSVKYIYKFFLVIRGYKIICVLIFHINYYLEYTLVLFRLQAH